MQTGTEIYGASNIFVAMQRIAQRENIGGLTKGMLPRLVVNVPASGLFTFSYELVLSLSRLTEDGSSCMLAWLSDR